jgi:hypothetical protein
MPRIRWRDINADLKKKELAMVPKFIGKAPEILTQPTEDPSMPTSDELAIPNDYLQAEERSRFVLADGLDLSAPLIQDVLSDMPILEARATASTPTDGPLRAQPAAIPSSEAWVTPLC